MVQEEMGKSQREYILRQQMKAIREELGEGGDDDEIEELRERLRPRPMRGAGATGGERLALERVQALELQVTTGQQRERDLLELSVRDGNQIERLQAQVASPRSIDRREADQWHAVLPESVNVLPASGTNCQS